MILFHHFGRRWNELEKKPDLTNIINLTSTEDSTFEPLYIPGQCNRMKSEGDAQKISDSSTHQILVDPFNKRVQVSFMKKNPAKVRKNTV